MHYYSRMILLHPTITNKVALTLSEATTLASPIYLFELINNQTFEKFYFIADDISPFTYRYNLFEIVVKTNPNPLNGEVNLTIGEEYKYNIYEQLSTTNLDPTLSTGIVEVGILRYDLKYAARNEYESDRPTRKVYKRS